MTAPTTLAATWAELTGSLTAAGFAVVEGIPKAVNPPAIVIGAGDPYLTQGQTWSAFKVELELFVIFAVADWSTLITTANGAILQAVDAIPDRWALRDVSPPFKATNLSGLPASRARISTDIQEG